MHCKTSCICAPLYVFNVLFALDMIFMSGNGFGVLEVVRTSFEVGMATNDAKTVR